LKIFFRIVESDEIQGTPHAIQALRYFYEERPNLPVVGAGSLLEFTLADHHFSMPVGRITYYHLGPLTFKEFLSAASKTSYTLSIRKTSTTWYIFERYKIQSIYTKYTVFTLFNMSNFFSKHEIEIICTIFDTQ
jgi:predicted AAA+ superfamily ATPase